MRKKKVKKAKYPDATGETYRAVLWVSKGKDFDGKVVYDPFLTIGVQSIKFGRECETFKEAKWYCNMMQNALQNFLLTKEIVVKKKGSYPRFTHHK